jgi:CHAT domain-containing protein
VKQQAYEDLLARIQLSNPELASLVTIPDTTVAGSQALLDGQTALVAYYLTDENALAFVLSRADYQVIELPASADEIARAVDGFRSLGLANLGNPHPRSLSDLYEWLVVPLEPHLTTPKVGIIPHQALHYVPFAALTDGEQFFGERFALYYLPSAGTLPFIQTKAGREQMVPLILGDPETGNADLPRLTHAAQEAALVADLFGSEPLLGAEASEGVVRARAGEAGVVHLAAHGAFNQAAPLFSRLWLAPGGEEDGRLNVHEVYGLDLNRADLVVLSACQTQVGELSAGDEVVGLTRAFLYGAPTVVASLWSVDDAATGALMARFYERLLAGKGKAEALQAAQAALRADPAHPEWAHPYYWAAFVLSGEPGRVSTPPLKPTPSPTPTQPPAAEAAPTPPVPDDGAETWLVPSVVLAVALLVGGFLAIRVIRKRT